MKNGETVTHNERALAAQEPAGGALAIWNREEIDVIRALICPGASDAELSLFAKVCAKTGLDPFSRQIYGIMRAQRQQVNGEWKTVEKLSIQTSIDGFRLVAERTGRYGGQLGPQWCGPDGVWRDVWLEDGYPSAARVAVIRTDWQQPLWSVATWKSYVQSYRNKQGQDIVGAQWQRMPDVMLAKCAESLALRRAFPQELSGLYTAEEMAQADREDVRQGVTVTRPTTAGLKQAQEIVQGEVVGERPFAAGTPAGATTPAGAAAPATSSGPATSDTPAETEDEPPFRYGSVQERYSAAAEYDRLTRVAIEKKHRHAAAIRGRPAGQLSDQELAVAIAKLQEWEQKVLAREAESRELVDAF